MNGKVQDRKNDKTVQIRRIRAGQSTTGQAVTWQDSTRHDTTRDKRTCYDTTRDKYKVVSMFTIEGLQ